MAKASLCSWLDAHHKASWQQVLLVVNTEHFLSIKHLNKLVSISYVSFQSSAPSLRSGHRILGYSSPPRLSPTLPDNSLCLLSLSLSAAALTSDFDSFSEGHCSGSGSVTLLAWTWGRWWPQPVHRWLWPCTTWCWKILAPGHRLVRHTL